MSDKILYKCSKDNPLILGIESSCDETAASVIYGRKVLSDEIISSAQIHARFGGVVPEIASRVHTDAVDEVVSRALKVAGIGKEELDAVAVTYGSGLLGALLVGLSFAKGFAYGLGISLIGVNHIRGHLAAAYLEAEDLCPPFVTLLASGGHTAILYARSETEFEALGSTLDDAVGEAFDKIARVLGLPYPGGPCLEALARMGKDLIPLPKMLKGEGGYLFSYSGLKTAIINYIHTKEQKGEPWSREDVACSFQKAALDILVQKTVEAALEKEVGTVTAGGGVVANGYLRERLSEACEHAHLRLVLPEKKHCTDNGAMIASEGLIQYRNKNFSLFSLNAEAYIPLNLLNSKKN